MAEHLALLIRKPNGEHDFRAAAQIMGTSEPWVTLGRTPELIYPNLINPQLEVLLAIAGEEVVGIISMAIPIPLIKGYIAALATAKDFRNRGVGAKLLAAAEERIFRESPNVFLCVTTFNLDAQRFYKRHGYELIGEIKDYSVAGHGELLMRKTRGPWSTFKAS